MSVFLNRMAGYEKVISLNLDDNSIRNVQTNPFEYFVNLEEISLANNLITELTKGIENFIKMSKGMELF
jgi:Leucine-rich repeat (LRR) protein